MNKQEFNRHYERIKEKFYSIDQKNANLVEGIFLHEAGNILNQIELLRQLSLEDSKLKEIEEMAIEESSEIIKKLIHLEPILSIKNFTKEGLIHPYESNVYNELMKEKSYMKNLYDVNIQLKGEQNVSTRINPYTLNAFISTNIGDAAKWTPENEDVIVNLSQDKNNFRLTIENKFSDSPVRSEIGMGKKIGSKYTQIFLDTIGGEKNEYTKNNCYIKDFYLPKLN